MKILANGTIYLFLLSFMLVSCGPGEKKAKNGSGEEPLPNIVLIVGDDHGYPYFGFQGADYMITPSMDELAASGTLFVNGYVPDNHCKPSLQALMTGTPPIQYWKEVARLREKQKPESDEEFDFHAMQYFNTLPRLLSTKGYVSFQSGKWWEFNYQNGGFTEGMTTGWTEEDKASDGWFLKYMGGDGTEVVRSTMQPVYDFIDKYQDRHFFLWFAPELPHWPFDAPDRYYNLYRDKDMSESAKRYYANCTWFDEGVGKLVDYMKKKDVFDNTLFVYVNDNGWEQDPHQEFRHIEHLWHNGGLKGKGAMYDMSFRTPIIFSWKQRIGKGVVLEDLIHSADIPATILDYAGISIPEDYFGMSYTHVVAGKEPGPRNEIIGNIDTHRSTETMMGTRFDGLWLRNLEWFFRWDVEKDIKALFNMTGDPRNDHDVSAQYPELIKEFSDKTKTWKELFSE